jgi:hypothetical protein
VATNDTGAPVIGEDLCPAGARTRLNAASADELAEYLEEAASQ